MSRYSIFEIHGNSSDQHNDYNNLKGHLEKMGPEDKLRLFKEKANGETPFAIACKARSLRTVELLLKHGAEVEPSALKSTSDEIREVCGEQLLINRLGIGS